MKMKPSFGLVALAFAATSVVAVIPDIPISTQKFSEYGYQIYPWPENSDAYSLDQVIDILSTNKATPQQTMLLIYSAKNSGKIFKNVGSLDFVNLNEYPQYDEEGECTQYELDVKTAVCDELEASKDGSLLYQNLNELCVDLKEKMSQFCSDKTVNYETASEGELSDDEWTDAE